MDQSVFEGAMGLVIALVMGVLGYFHLNISSLRTEMDKLKETTAEVLDAKIGEIRDDIGELRKEMQEDRRNDDVKKGLDRIWREIQARLPPQQKSGNIGVSHGN